MGIERGRWRHKKQDKEQDRGTGGSRGGTRCRLRQRGGEGKKDGDRLLDRDRGRKSRARVGKRERKKGTAAGQRDITGNNETGSRTEG